MLLASFPRPLAPPPWPWFLCPPLVSLFSSTLSALPSISITASIAACADSARSNCTNAYRPAGLSLGVAASPEASGARLAVRMVTVAIGPIFAKAASMDASSADCGMLRTNTAVTGSCVSFSCVVLCAGAGSAGDAAGALGGAAGLGLDAALGALAAAAARIFAAMDAYVVGPSGSFASVSGSTMAAGASLTTSAAAAASAASLTTSAAALALACTFGAAAFILASSSSRDTAPVGRVGAGGAVTGGSGAFTGADTAVSAATSTSAPSSLPRNRTKSLRT